MLIYLGPSLIDWKSRKQQLVATSTMDAELNALSLLTAHILFTRDFSRKALPHIFKDTPSPIVYCDNQPTVDSVMGWGTGSSKHMSIRLFFVRDLIRLKMLRLEWISTSAQRADPLTKPLQAVMFPIAREQLGVVPMPQQGVRHNPS
jgi:hypothetical protein